MKKQKEKAALKRRQLLEQGKIISDQESLLKCKQELIEEKNALIKEYRRIVG